MILLAPHGLSLANSEANFNHAALKPPILQNSEVNMYIIVLCVSSTLNFLGYKEAGMIKILL
jgi:hypothetical protein